MGPRCEEIGAIATLIHNVRVSDPAASVIITGAAHLALVHTGRTQAPSCGTRHRAVPPGH
jgi:hypothetical protein